METMIIILGLVVLFFFLSARFDPAIILKEWTEKMRRRS